VEVSKNKTVYWILLYLLCFSYVIIFMSENIIILMDLETI